MLPICRDTREVERVRAARLMTSLQAEVSELRRGPPRRSVESQTVTTVAELRQNEALLRQMEGSKAAAEREVETAGLDAEQAALDAQVKTQREKACATHDRTAAFWGLALSSRRSWL